MEGHNRNSTKPEPSIKRPKIVAIYILALSSLATGAALLVYFISSLSLIYGLMLTLAIASGAAAWVWYSVPKNYQQGIKIRVKAGLIAGLFATIGYDLSRLLIVELGGLTIWPFDTFRLFGELLIGENQAFALPIGTLYHLLNGISFGLAYTLVLGERGWLGGIIWALILEFLMVTFYPTWLDIKVLDEFLTVSVVGHLVYGFILGWGSQKLLLRFAKEPK